MATAAVVLWQNAHVAVLWDASYTLESAARIALGQMPYRDFPFVHAPLTFLIQAVIIRLTGRVFFHHVVYAALMGGFGTVLAWRIVLRTLSGLDRFAFAISLLLAAPLAFLGVYSILPFPSYDCDCSLAILAAVWCLQRLDSTDANGQGSRWRGFVAGCAICLPLFVKQNMGVPFLFAAVVSVLLLVIASLLRLEETEPDQVSAVAEEVVLGNGVTAGAKAPYSIRDVYGPAKAVPLLQSPFRLSFSAACIARRKNETVCGTSKLVPFYKTPSSQPSSTSSLVALLAGTVTSLLAALLVLHFTAGIGNYVRWTIQFAGQRRLPGLAAMAGIYADPNLRWMLPAIAAAIALLAWPRRSVRTRQWASISAFLLTAAPFLFVLSALWRFYDDADTFGDTLMTLWPLVMILAAADAVGNVVRFRALKMSSLLSLILLAAIHGTMLSQQLWGSTYAIWPLLTILIACLLGFIAQLSFLRENSGSLTMRAIVRPAAKAGPTTSPLFSSLKAAAPSDLRTESVHALPSFAGSICWFIPTLASVIGVTLLVCGAFYTLSEERLSYVNLSPGPVEHSAFPQLAGASAPGPYLPEIDELLRYAAANIPQNDGLILLPGEDPFYFVTGRAPQFPVLLFDRTTDPYSPEETVALARARDIRWLVVKRDLQIKEDVTPERTATLELLLREFKLAARLRGYDIYKRF